METTAFIRAGLDQAVEDGQLRASTDTTALARYVNSVIIGMAVTAHDGATTEELLALADVAGAALKRARAA